MKKRSLFWVSIFTLLMVTPVDAQQRIGFVGGLNISNAKGVFEPGDDIDFSSGNDFGIGAVLDLGLNQNFVLRLEPMYLRKSGAYEADFDPEGRFQAKFGFKIAYLEVPVFLKLAAQTNTIQPYIMAGPTVGLLLSAKTKIDAPAIGVGVEVNTEDILNFIDFGLGFGAGMNFSTGKNAIFVECRYTHGLFNVADEGHASAGDFEFEVDEGFVVKTGGVQILAGMTLPFGVVSISPTEGHRSPTTGTPHRIGFVGGLNIASVNVVDPDGADLNFSSRTVFGLGLVLDLALNQNLSLLFEPMYLQKGAEVTLDSTPSKFEAAYLEVPVFFKFAYGTRTVRPYVMAGPTVGFNLSSDLQFSAFDQDFENDIEKLTRRLDFGLGFGAGVSFPISNTSIFIESRYMLGLSDFTEAGVVEEAGFEPIEFGERLDLRTKGIQIMLGITFPLGGE